MRQDVLNDFMDKIYKIVVPYAIPALVIGLAVVLAMRFVWKKKYGLAGLFFWSAYSVLIVCETVIRRLDLFKETTDFIGIRELFLDPWYVVAACENVVMFLPFGFLFCLAFWKQKPFYRWRNVTFCTVLLCLSVEVIQYVLQIGEAELLDILTNLLGSWIGYGCMALVFRLAGRNRKK